MNKILYAILFLALFSCENPEVLNEKSTIYANGLHPFEEYGKWGYINSQGDRIIKCQFNKAQRFQEGLATVLIDNLWGCIDTNGTIIIAPQFQFISGFSDGLSLVILNDVSLKQKAFIDRTGKVAFKTNYHPQGNFNNGRALVKVNDEICYIDKKGKIVINTDYPYGTAFCEGIAKVWTGDSSKYIDTSGQIVFKLDGMGHHDFKEGLVSVRINGQNCFLNKNGEVVVDSLNSTWACFDYSDGLAQVTIPGTNHKSGFIDKSGALVIPIKYSNVRNFSEGLAAFKDSSLWGFINKKGDTVIPPQFESISYGFSNGLCRFEKNSAWGYINQVGNIIWQTQKNIQYRKLDLSLWELDTLNLRKAKLGGVNAQDRNTPRRISFSSGAGLKLQVDTVDLTVYNDRFFAYKIYLINSTNDTVQIPAQDGRIKIMQQALDLEGKWLDTERFINSFCGNSYHSFPLLPSFYQVYATPITKGEFKTRLRYRLELYDRTIYSNEYIGNINAEQITNTL
ncbi:hypothetical protein DNU06_17075 [Putridiphycobacter roseus]|uniref:WG repeat-containing protein n=1 Tax=Putridiphycobacter roseus TaxID=2219161 RepID=A0A2W1MW83_9FLAO|nr:WG repeat-containing protein [Putridiphycobacter roseus]PZE15634.1 hypothetical protein DNU06_17075 [Putridiphycobacter roseus]